MEKHQEEGEAPQVPDADFVEGDADDDEDRRRDEPADRPVRKRAGHLLPRPVFDKAKEPPLQHGRPLVLCVNHQEDDADDQEDVQPLERERHGLADQPDEVKNGHGVFLSPGHPAPLADLLHEHLDRFEKLGIIAERALERTASSPSSASATSGHLDDDVGGDPLGVDISAPGRLVPGRRQTRARSRPAAGSPSAPGPCRTSSSRPRRRSPRSWRAPETISEALALYPLTRTTMGRRGCVPRGKAWMVRRWPSRPTMWTIGPSGRNLLATSIAALERAAGIVAQIEDEPGGFALQLEKGLLHLCIGLFAEALKSDVTQRMRLVRESSQLDRGRHR